MPRKTIDDLLETARACLERIEPADALDAVEREGALLVDIRSELQRARDGMVPAALHHSRNVLEWRADPASAHRDPRLSDDLERRLILFCHEGYASSLAAATLKDLGFVRATDMVGGFQAWRDAGLPVHYSA